MECGNCGAVPIYRHERCAARWIYRRRHKGQERPEELVVAHGRRVLEQHLERKAWGLLLEVPGQVPDADRRASGQPKNSMIASYWSAFGGRSPASIATYSRRGSRRQDSVRTPVTRNTCPLTPTDRHVTAGTALPSKPGVRMTRVFVVSSNPIKPTKICRLFVRCQAAPRCCDSASKLDGVPAGPVQSKKCAW